jgi:hypothetical protein
MSRLLSRIGLIGLLATFGALELGCASGSRAGATASGDSSGEPTQPAAMSVPGVARTATAADALRSTADELGKLRQTIGETVTALQALPNAQGDLLAPFGRFMALHAEVDEGEHRLAQRGDEMRARARDYITNWEVEVYGVEDPDLRAQADTRRNQVRDDYGRIHDAGRAVREAMQPFQRQLDDLQTVLANDLTPAGVRAAAPAVRRAEDSGQGAQQRIDGFIAELDRVASTMTPTVPATSGGTTGQPAAPRGNNK